MRNHYVFKICTVGSNYELNNQLIELVSESKFNPDRSETIGVQILSKGITVQGKEVKLIFHVVRGEKHFERLRRFYYEGSVGCIIVYEKEDHTTIEVVNQWCNEYRLVQGMEKPIALLRVTNESEKDISEEGKVLADDLGISYFECLPTDGKKIDEVLKFLTKKIVESEIRKLKKK